MTSLVPIDSTRRTKLLVKVLSRSRKRYRGAVSYGNALRTLLGGPLSGGRGRDKELSRSLSRNLPGLPLEHHQLMPERDVLKREIASTLQRGNDTPTHDQGAGQS